MLNDIDQNDQKQFEEMYLMSTCKTESEQHNVLMSKLVLIFLECKVFT